MRTRLVQFDPLEQTAVMEMQLRHTVGDELLATERHTIDLGLYFKNEIVLMLQLAGFTDIKVTAFGHDWAPHPWHDVRIAIHVWRR